MNTSNLDQTAQVPTITIHVDRFQPFKSRVGFDEVVRLQFIYDPALIAKIKALLCVYQVGTEHKVVGGWLPKYKCWFIEPDVWAVIKIELLYLGHRIMERKP